MGKGNILTASFSTSTDIFSLDDNSFTLTPGRLKIELKTKGAGNAVNAWLEVAPEAWITFLIIPAASSGLSI